jgi:hypothetical protein
VRCSEPIEGIADGDHDGDERAEPADDPYQRLQVARDAGDLAIEIKDLLIG